MVTPLERIMAARMFEESDRVPVFCLFGGAARRVCGVTYDTWAKNPDIIAESLIQIQKLFEFDTIMAFIDLCVEPAAFGQKVVFPIASTPYSAGFMKREDLLIRTIEDYEKIEPVNPDPKMAPRTEDIIKVCEKLIQETGGEIPTTGFIYGPAGTLAMMRTLELLSIDLVKNPKPVHKALRIITDFLVEYAKAQCETGVQSICLDILFCSKEIWGRKLWEEFEGKYAREIADEVEKHNVMVGVHNCAHGPYFDTMIKYFNPAFISYQYLPDDCKDFAELKEKYGKKTVLVGQIDTRNLAVMKPEEIEEEAKEQIKILGSGGGFILAPGCEFPPNAPLINAKAMVDAARKYARAHT